MPEGEFAGRTALVTGGARGMGRAICVKLARAGASVAVNYLSREDAAFATKELVEREGAKCLVVQADVSDPEAVRTMVRRTREALGPIDLLAANAGAFVIEGHETITPDSWRRMFAINLDGVFLSVMAVKDEMLERNFGCIVCTSSMTALQPRPEILAYATAKAGVIAFVRNCALAFAPHVRINCVAPGLTRTDAVAQWSDRQLETIVERTPLNRIGEPDEIAEVVAFLLSERSGFMTGQTLVSDGGRVTLP